MKAAAAYRNASRQLGARVARAVSWRLTAAAERIDPQSVTIAPVEDVDVVVEPKTEPEPELVDPAGIVNEQYVSGFPTHQNALNLFAGDWASTMPAGSGLTAPGGTVGLFEDARITWFGEQAGGFAGRSVLELGPLDGGHTYMMHAAGVSRVVGVEMNRKAFTRCLCVKNVFDLSRATFLLGDCMEYLDNPPERFDLILACGVLYHMHEPVRMIELLAENADAVMVWTHYFDESVIRESDVLSRKFGPIEKGSHAGFDFEYAQQSYLEFLQLSGFGGGSAPASRWLTRESLFGAFCHFGLTDITTAFDDAAHMSGPAVAFYASRPKA